MGMTVYDSPGPLHPEWVPVTWSTDVGPVRLKWTLATPYPLRVLVTLAGHPYIVERPVLEIGRSRPCLGDLTPQSYTMRVVVLDFSGLDEFKAHDITQEWRVHLGVIRFAAADCERHVADFKARHVQRERIIDYALKAETLPPGEAIRVEPGDRTLRLPRTSSGAPMEAIELRPVRDTESMTVAFAYWSEARQRLFFYGDERIARNGVRSGLAEKYHNRC